MASKFVFALAICALAAVPYAEGEIFSDKYDYVDIDSILANDRLRNQYYSCVTEAGPCLTPDAKFFREKLPEAVVTKCRKCSPKMKMNFEKLVRFYTENEPEKWRAILIFAMEKSQKKKV